MSARFCQLYSMPHMSDAPTRALGEIIVARTILTTPGEDVDVGGTVTVIGTRTGGEVITITRGNITLDASFNAGGDTIVLPGSSGGYTVQLSGSQAIIASGSVTVSIPLGTAGTAIQFSNTTLSLLINTSTGTAMLGEQTLTSTAQPIAATPSESLYGTNVIFEEEPNDTPETADLIDRALLESSPDDPNLTDPTIPSVELRGQIEDNNDVDFYAIFLNAGETITLDVDGAYNPDDVSGLDSVIGILNEAGDAVADNDDGDTLDAGSTSELDSFLTYQAPASGTYYIVIGSFDFGEPGGSPENYHLLVSVDEAAAAQQLALGVAKDSPAAALDETMMASLHVMTFA